MRLVKCERVHVCERDASDNVQQEGKRVNACACFCTFMHACLHNKYCIRIYFSGVHCVMIYFLMHVQWSYFLRPGECMYFHMPTVAFTLFLHACACVQTCV